MLSSFNCARGVGFLAAAMLCGWGFAGLAGGADAPDVPDPSAMLPVVQEAATAGPPPCIKAGTRLTYFGMTASIPGAYKRLVEDENGAWVDEETGKRYREDEIASAAAGGFNIVHVGYVDRQIAQWQNHVYLLNTATKKCGFAFASGAVGHAGCAADYWIHPDVLKKIADAKGPGVRILHMPYTLPGGKKYPNAIRFQTEDIRGYQAHVYDLETGLMIYYGARSQSGPVQSAPIGGWGKAVNAEGSTQIVVSWLIEQKDLETPWKDAAPPDWAARFQGLDYKGTQSATAAGTGTRLDRALTASAAPKATGANWARYTTSFTIESFRGMPPEQFKQEGACGIASVGGIWMAPKGLAAMRQGDVLERNEHVGTTLTVTQAGRGTVAITESGPVHSIEYTYDANSGVLLGTVLTQQAGTATIVHRAQLTRQP